MASRPKASEEAKRETEFDRFRRLTKKLLGVPKDEIDRKVKAEERKRRATG